MGKRTAQRPTALEALEAGDRDATLAALASVDAAERRKVAPTFIKLYKRWNVGDYVTEPDKPNHYVWQNKEGSDGQRKAALAGVIAVATAAELVKERKLPRLNNHELVLATARVVPPHWLNPEGLEVLAREWRINWLTVETLVEAGLCARPRADELIESLIEGLGFRSDRGLTALLRQHPGLIRDGVLYRVFEVEGGQQTSLAAADKYRGTRNQWATALMELTAAGELERERLLDGTLDALARDFATFRAGWFTRFHDNMLVPTDAERGARSAAYLRLLGSTIPSTVSFAVKAVEKLLKLGLLEPAALLDALPPALQARQKGTVKRAAKLLRAAVKRTPDAAAQAAGVAIDALAHPDSDVQSALLDVIEGMLELVEEGQREALIEQLSAARDLVAPSLRARLPGSPGPAVCSEAAAAPPAVDADPFSDSYALEVATSHTDALDRVAYALEHSEDPVAQEVALDAVARFAAPTDNWTELAGPLRKRAKGLWKRAHREDDQRMALCYVALAWTTGEKVTWPKPLYKDHQIEPTFQIYLGRIKALVNRVAAGEALPWLSTPTHVGGHVSPATLKARLKLWKKARQIPDLADAVLALMRLPANKRKQARRSIKIAGDKAARALDHAAQPQQSDFAMRVKSRKSGRYTFYEIEAAPRPKVPASQSWQQLRHRLSSGNAYGQWASDEGGIGSEGNLYRWNATIVPDELAPHFAAGVRYLSFYLDGTLACGLHLEPALQPWAQLGETGHWLLLLALAARGARAVEVGLDVAIDGIAQGRVEVEALGGVLGQLMPTGMLKTKRLATTLAQVAEASGRHAQVVREVIARGLRGDPAAASRDVGALLSVLHELLIAGGVRLENKEARQWLELQQRGGKVAKARKAILAL